MADIRARWSPGTGKGQLSRKLRSKFLTKVRLSKMTKTMKNCLRLRSANYCFPRQELLATKPRRQHKWRTKGFYTRKAGTTCSEMETLMELLELLGTEKLGLLGTKVFFREANFPGDNEQMKWLADSRTNFFFVVEEKPRLFSSYDKFCLRPKCQSLDQIKIAKRIAGELTPCVEIRFPVNRVGPYPKPPD